MPDNSYGNGKTVTWKWVAATLLTLLLMVLGALISIITSTTDSKIQALKEDYKALHTELKSLTTNHGRLEKRVQALHYRIRYGSKRPPRHHHFGPPAPPHFKRPPKR